MPSGFDHRVSPHFLLLLVPNVAGKWQRVDEMALMPYLHSRLILCEVNRGTLRQLVFKQKCHRSRRRCHRIIAQDMPTSLPAYPNPHCYTNCTVNERVTVVLETGVISQIASPLWCEHVQCATRVEHYLSGEFINLLWHRIKSLLKLTWRTIITWWYFDTNPVGISLVEKSLIMTTANSNKGWTSCVYVPTS